MISDINSKLSALYAQSKMDTADPSAVEVNVRLETGKESPIKEIINDVQEANATTLSEREAAIIAIGKKDLPYVLYLLQDD